MRLEPDFQNDGGRKSTSFADKRRLPPAVEWVHHLLSARVQQGACVVDATAGNGFDTLFLARQVGPKGRVFAFDIQSEALEVTRRLLLERQIAEAVCTLLLESHARMADALPADLTGRVDAVLFNLGFRPGCDKSLTTRATSTLVALNAALLLLAAGGVLSVIAYPGHPEGKDEADQVAAWMRALTPDRFEVQNIRAVNRIKQPPELWLVLRL